MSNISSKNPTPLGVGNVRKHINRINIKGLYLCVFILFVIGCQHIQNDMNPEPDGLISIAVDKGTQDNMTYSSNVFIGDAGNKFGTDAFALDTATIEGDILKVNLSYSGGCKSHQFTLVASDLFHESSPVQLPIYIAHNANGDTCEAYPTEDYHFNLTPIKDLYQKRYRQDAGTIILKLKDAPEGELVYKFTM